MGSKVEELLAGSESLDINFEQGGGTNCLSEAIVLGREALDICPSGHPMRQIPLTSLAIHLWKRFERLGMMTDLEEAVVLDREALALRPSGHQDRAISLNNLAIRLETRFSQLGAMEDLSEAIVLDREALSLFPLGHPYRWASLRNLALHLSTRYKQLGAVEDLDEAIALDREALALFPPGDPDKWMGLSSIAKDLAIRYERLGAMKDLDEAIVLDREALALCQPSHPGRSAGLDNLALCLSARYSQLGTIADLNEAVVLGREALALLPPGHSERSLFLTNLTFHLSIRYKQLGAMADLNEGIFLNREALALRPPGHPDRSMSLNNLAVYLSNRYQRLEEVDDLNEAIALNREALALRPSGHPYRWQSLNNIAYDLATRYMQFATVRDLDEAIILGRDTLALFSPGHPRRSLCLTNLAGYLYTRYEQLAEIEDLNEAIDLDRDTLMLRPPGHPYRSVSLNHLAFHLSTRYKQAGEMQDYEELFNLYTQLAHVQQTVASSDLFAANAWVDATEDYDHPTKLLAYETSLRLLVQHLATLPSLPQHLPILKSLTSSLAVDAFSACLRNNLPIKAIELLEQGRGVFWNQLSHLRSPLEDVIASGPTGNRLAEKFTQLTALIHNALDSPGADQHDRMCRLNCELQSIVTDIRGLPGLSRFLYPSLFPDLQQAACEGPVVIVNASKYTCDVLIILADRDPVHIPLSITKEHVRELASDLRILTVRAKRMDVTKQLAIIFRELWDDVVSHIVDFLRTTSPRRSRIWWCPTAEFSLLPLHAAGCYRKGQPNLAHLYISSYTPTLDALIHARRHDPPNSQAKGKKFLAIGQSTPIGAGVLPSVRTELTNIGQRVQGLTTFTRIEGPESCMSRVDEELGKNEWVHLACHGIPNPEQPFESAFALHDGHFTIERIIRCELVNPQFAYLSACHTTVGDEESPDEVIHLASAMQFVGFRSVIGTMWAVDDGVTNKITSMFYDNMVDESGQLDHTRAAFALHRTMRTLVDIPLDQRILYIHIGA